MFWLYHLLTVQAVSNLIGIIEVSVATLIALGHSPLVFPCSVALGPSSPSYSRLASFCQVLMRSARTAINKEYEEMLERLCKIKEVWCLPQ
jgi:hypothetical protein